MHDEKRVVGIHACTQERPLETRGKRGDNDELTNFGVAGRGLPLGFFVSVADTGLKWCGINSCGSVDSERVRRTLFL